MTSSTTGFVRHRRSKRAIATFSVFEADLLRSLAAQLVELLHNESAVVATERDPLEALLDFSGPKAEKFHADVVKLVKKSHSVISVDKWNEAAEEMD